MSQDLPSLNDRFAIPDHLCFDAGGGGLTRAVVTGPECAGELYLHGAHVTRWQPAGQAPVLWMSPVSDFADGHPIRGGVPLCFPWFGPKAGDPDAPAHGRVRTAGWDVADTGRDERGVTITLTHTVGLWACTLTATFGRKLTTALGVRNTSDAPATFEAALHTYLGVGDVRRVAVTGLEGVGYLDKMDGGGHKTQPGAPIVFVGETDRVYLDTEGPVTVHDPAMGRRITVTKAGSQSTVVWNPWTAKAARMADFPDDGWPGMVCVETANVASNAVTLEPGSEHALSATLGVGPLDAGRSGR